MSVYILCMALLSIGLYCMVRKRNLIKTIVGFVVAEYAANLFFIMVAYQKEGRAPIFSPDQHVTTMVDALPQGVVLTSIIIGMATTTVLIALALRIYEKYGTFDITKIRELNG